MAGESKTYEYKVAMTCEGCSNQVLRVLDRLKGKGVENVDIALQDQRVKVTTSLSSEDILNVLKKTGKSVEFVGATNV